MHNRWRTVSSYTVPAEIICKVSKTNTPRITSYNIIPHNNPITVMNLLFWSLCRAAAHLLSSLDQIFCAILTASKAAHLLLTRSMIALSIISLQVAKGFSVPFLASSSTLQLPGMSPWPGKIRLIGTTHWSTAVNDVLAYRTYAFKHSKFHFRYSFHLFSLHFSFSFLLKLPATIFVWKQTTIFA